MNLSTIKKEPLHRGPKQKVRTLNDAFDLFLAERTDLKHSSRLNYEYLYNRYVRTDIGRQRITSLCYSDFRTFYMSLSADYRLSKKTLLLIHSVINQLLKEAVRDNIILTNPTEGVIHELSRRNGWEEKKRHALTPEQQTTFLNYAMTHAEFAPYVSLFIFLLGTGCRIGEALGLRWDMDIDFDAKTISINHSLQYRKLASGKTGHYISTPKTTSGNRIIPMISVVMDALLTEKKRQEEFSCSRENYSPPIVNGYTNFVFLNRHGGLYHAIDINRAIKNLVHSYNREEISAAALEHRKPLLLPDISCHHLRHTFCSRLCENETNLKIIQDIMGHASITTTMNRYAEASERKKAESMLSLENKIFVF